MLARTPVAQIDLCMDRVCEHAESAATGHMGQGPFSPDPLDEICVQVRSAVARYDVTAEEENGSRIYL